MEDPTDNIGCLKLLIILPAITVIAIYEQIKEWIQDWRSR